MRRLWSCVAASLVGLSLAACVPSFPGGSTLTASPSGTLVTLVWPAASPEDDGQTITSYRIDVDGVQVAGVPAPVLTCSLTGLRAGSHIVSVTAYDSAGEWSGSASQDGTLNATVTPAVPAPSSAPYRCANIVDPFTSSTPWRDMVNYYRTTAGIAPVTANAAWVAGLQNHFLYLANTPPALRQGQYANAHTENPASPWYTVDGEAAGRSSNLGSDAGSDRANIERWMRAPFHAIGILRPGLSQSAYAAGSGHTGIDVIRGLNPGTAPKPVLFPAQGSITTLKSFGGENPNPLESCPGYGASAGLPIVAMLPSPPTQETSATLTLPSGSLLSDPGSICVVTAATYFSSDLVYGPTGRSILQGANAVLIIPKAPLNPGLHTVRLEAGGSPVIWSFGVA